MRMDTIQLVSVNHSHLQEWADKSADGSRLDTL